MKVVGETATDYFGKSLEAELARAAAEGKTDKIEALIKQGANVNASGNKNMSPLGWAIAAHNIPGIRALLKNGANPNQSIGPDHDFHPVWLAAGLEDSSILKLLLEFKGDPNATHKGPEFNALMKSVMQLESLKLLVAAGADVNQSNPIGNAIGLDAAGLGQYDAVIYLISHGYTHNLLLLAWEVKNRPISDELKPKQQKILELLKEKGVTPPEGNAPKMY